MSFSTICKSPYLKAALLSHSKRALEIRSQSFHSSQLFFAQKREGGQRWYWLDGTQITPEMGRVDSPVATITKEDRKALEVIKKNEVTIDAPNHLSTVSGVPTEHVTQRRVRIHKPAKNAMQSGTWNTQKWKIDYENRERWENPLMGWTSSGDPLSNMNMWFTNKEDAIEYCERQGLVYEVDEEQPRRNLKKTYAENFSWNKRTRVDSK